MKTIDVETLTKMFLAGAKNLEAFLPVCGKPVTDHAVTKAE